MDTFDPSRVQKAIDEHHEMVMDELLLEAQPYELPSLANYAKDIHFIPLGDDPMEEYDRNI
jgi:hypothetical protein